MVDYGGALLVETLEGLYMQRGRVAKHANKKDEVRNHKGVSKPRLFA